MRTRISFGVEEKHLVMFSADVIEKIDNYVYRLVDPRDFQTFYVGRGNGNRVFDHAKDELKQFEEGKDEATEKIQQIRDIRLSGKEVICIIHRYGLTLDQAREVESALIDCYYGLTNLIGGYGSDRGVITAGDLQLSLERPIYEEPDNIEYIIIKTSNSAIQSNGNLYEATRRAWYAKLERAKNVRYVLSVINGIVREVYEVDEWCQSPVATSRIEFTGKPACDEIANLFKNKMIPKCYREKGIASPFLYKKANTKEEAENPVRE